MPICEFCHQSFNPPPGITTCWECYRRGLAHEPLYAVLLRDLRAAIKGLSGTVSFTFVGDGDFVLEVRGLGLFPIIVATVAMEREDGTWTTRPAVPDPDFPWAIALFGNKTEWPHWPEITKLPATDAEVVAFVTQHRSRLDVFAPGQGCAICGLPRPCGCRIEQEA